MHARVYKDRCHSLFWKSSANCKVKIKQHLSCIFICPNIESILKEASQRFIANHLSCGYILSLSSPLWLPSTSIRVMLAQPLHLSVWEQSNSALGAALALSLSLCGDGAWWNELTWPLYSYTDWWAAVSSGINVSGLQSAHLMRNDRNEANHAGGNYTFGWGQIRGKRLHQRFTFTSHFDDGWCSSRLSSLKPSLPHGDMLIHISCVCLKEKWRACVCIPPWRARCWPGAP